MTWKDIRYAIVRLWTCPIPGVQYSLPLLGGRTIPEAIAVIGIVLGLLAAGLGGGAGFSGDLVTYVAFLLIFFAIRSNILLTHLFNISFERGLLYHKAFGVGLMSLVLIHAVGEGMNTTGIILGITMLGAPLVYLFEYLFGKFNLFYYPHVTLSIITIPVSFIHGAPLLGFALILWMVDVFFRYVIQGKRTVANASLISDDILRLEIPATADTQKSIMRYDAGQFCFLMVPGINVVEYHPFTIASAPAVSSATNTTTPTTPTLPAPSEAGSIVFYIKKNGDWTDKLYHLIEKQVNNADKNTNTNTDNKTTTMTTTSASIPVTLCLEGPYGQLSVDMFNGHIYDSVVLVCGGVGVTPIHSLLTYYIHHLTNNTNTNTNTNKNKHPFPKHVYVLWSIRDQAFAAHMWRQHWQPLLQHAQFQKLNHNNHNHNHQLEGASYAKYSPSIEENRHAHTATATVSVVNDPQENGEQQQQQHGVVVGGGSSNVGVQLVSPNKIVPTTSTTKYTAAATSATSAAAVVEDLRLLSHVHLSIYHTKGGNHTNTNELSAAAADSVVVEGKRPAYAQYFSDIAHTMVMQEEDDENVVVAKGNKRVAVAVCGPAAMVASIRDLCDQGVHVLANSTTNNSTTTNTNSNTANTNNTKKQQHVKVHFDCHEEIFNF